MPIKPIILRTLGTAQVDIGQVQVRPNAVRRFAALLYLSAEAGRRVPRRCLIDLLFPEQTERNGLHSLRELVYQLKTAGVGLEADQEGIELPGAAVRADYAELLASERLTMDQIRAAQGGFLPGYSPHGSEAFKEWFEPFRARTISGLSRVLLRDHDRARAVANLEVAESAARACLAVAPLNERAVKGLAETMVLGGAKADALRLLVEYRAEVGGLSPDLNRSAELLTRRVRERPDCYRTPGELPFTGRDAEMLELTRIFATARSGSTQCVVVIGEPGIGKSRLVAEFGAIAAVDATVQSATAQQHDHRRPMGIFVDLVPRLLDMPGALGIAPDSMTSLKRLTTSQPSDPPAGQAVFEPELVSRAITNALDDLVSAITLEAALIVIVEDSHWADPLSLRVLGELTTRHNRRFLAVLTSRERTLSDLGERVLEHATFLDLRPLDFTCCRDLAARSLSGSNGATHAELHAWMAEVANGNPLYLSSLVAHFLATGAPFAVPPSLQDLILKQLDHLDSAAILILQTCVLLGSLATLPRLVATLDQSFTNTAEGIAQLESLRMIRFVDGTLAPRHALIAEALLQQSSSVILQMLHLRIATVLEDELAPADSLSLLWNCAEHWIAAGEHGRALRFVRQCAEHARAIGRPGAAAQILLRVRSMQVDAQDRLSALEDAVRLAASGFEHELTLEGIKVLREIQPNSTHDDIELAELHALSVTHRDCTDYEDRLLTCVETATADPAHRVRAGVTALQYADNYSRPELAMRIIGSISDKDLNQVDEILALEYRLVQQAAFGNPEEGTNVARQLQQLAATISGTRGAGLLFNAVVALHRGGATREAFEGCRQVFDMATECAAVKLQCRSALQMAALLVDKGQFTESHSWRTLAGTIQCANSTLVDAFECNLLEIDFCLAEGNIDRARAVLLRTQQLGLFDSPSRQRWHRGLAALAAQFSGETRLPDSELTYLINIGNQSLPSSGIRDIEVAAICSELHRNGRSDEAREVFSDFLRNKALHSPGPIGRQLRLVLERSGLISEWNDLEPASMLCS